MWKYDKLKNGYNRDWETDNIPDDMTGDHSMTTEEILKAATPRPWAEGDYSDDIVGANRHSVCGDFGGTPFEESTGAEEWQANHALTLLAVNSYEKQRECIAELVAALRSLYDETADYISLNHLGDVHHNVSMQKSRSALERAKELQD